jgi:hypothetical protein
VIRLIWIRNPLQPSSTREIREIAPVDGQHLLGCISHHLYHDGIPPSEMVISLNGKIVPTEESTRFFPRDGDCIVVAPLLSGGSVWRTLAQVAVMAASVAMMAVPGLQLPGVLGMSAALTTSIAAGVVSIGGNMLIQTFLPAQPNTKAQSASYAFDGPQSLAQSGTVIPKGYGKFMSGGNIISSFVDVEGSDQYINALICFGFGPARTIADIEINQKAISTYQNVYYYTRAGTNAQEPIAGFNRIVNGYPQDVEVTCAGGPVVVPGTGTQTQALQVDVQFPEGVYYVSGDGNDLPCAIIYKVEYSISGLNAWQPVLQPLETQSVIVYNGDGTVNPFASPAWVLIPNNLPAGSGVCIDTSGNGSDPNPAGLHAGQAGSTTSNITTVDPDGTTHTVSQTFFGEWQPVDLTLPFVEVLSWTNGWTKYVADTTQVCYNRVSIYGLPVNKYDVRVTKYGSNNASNTVSPGDYFSPKRGQDVWIHTVNEITYQDLAYPNMILVGVRAQATNQIQGANLNVTAVIEYGLRTLDNNVLPAALQVFEEDNPACVAADMMLDDLYGGGEWPGIAAPNIERFIDEWVSWAELNDELVDDGNGNSIRRHVFNGIFDNEDNLWNQLNAVAQMSRAAIIPMGLDYGVFVDQADTPVQLFSMGNIIQDSFQEHWMMLDDRANQIEVQFADSTRYYRQDNPMVYIDPADMASGAIIKNVRINGKGITLPAQAWHFGRFKGLCNKLLLRLGQFQCDVDAIACRPGNLIILQHDVPQWGWGGRLLTGNSVDSIGVDRSDLPWDGTTAYNVVVLFAAVKRYVGTVTSVATDVDGTGLTIGTTVGLSFFDNANRVTRAVINGKDCTILSATPSSILVTVPPGFTPTTGQPYALYDTDVLETATVSGVTPGPEGTQVVKLGTPFSQAPDDYATYFYGVPGSQKIVRVTRIAKASDMRSTIEWIDYDPGCYIDATPIVGETSAQVTTNPGVTNLQAVEQFEVQSSGSYEDFINVTWIPGINTAGVGIYGSFGQATPQMLTRIEGYQSSWRFQVSPGVTWKIWVVGFDANDNYQAWSAAPNVTITTEGITTNLLADSSFQSGFVYWNLTPRAGDTLVPTFQNDGEAQYAVAGSTLAAATPILNQVVSPSNWQVGHDLMLSAYFETTGTPSGNLVADIAFYSDAGITLISAARAVLVMAGAAQTLVRVFCASTVVPMGTAQVRVRVLVDGTVSIPVASGFTVSHLLLEAPAVGQTVPSVWADIDDTGRVTDVFQLGSSSAMRAQASALPVGTGSFPFSYTDTTVTMDWSGLQIQWPDGGVTEIVNGSEAVTGLTAMTNYFAYPYFDIVNGGVKFVAPAAPVGSPALLTTVHDPVADAACKLDGRVPLAPGGLSVITAASGGSGSGSGGGSGSGSINVSVTPNPGHLSGLPSVTAFTATVTGTAMTAVVWSLGPGSVGTISGGGSWDPGSPPTHGSATIIATSVANSACQGYASVSW